MTAIDVKKFDSTEFEKIENLILSAKSINGDIIEYSYLNESVNPERRLEMIADKVGLIETLLDLAYEKLTIGHEACETIYNLNKELETSEEKEPDENSLVKQIEELEKTLRTEKYIKNCLFKFVADSGLSRIYHEEYRYQYAKENFDEFQQTYLYDQWKEARMLES